MERQQCEDCKYELFDAETEPCNTCVATDFHTFSNFTPKKDLNQLLREKLYDPENAHYFSAEAARKAFKDVNVDQVNTTKNLCVEVPMHDPINKPKHYMLVGNLEVRDVIAALVGKMHDPLVSHTLPDNALFDSDYVQMMQYGMRFMDKGGKQDLEKMRWYLDKLIEAYE